MQGSGFWVSNQDINYINNATSPEYADANYKGVLVSANENNATINYTKPINLKDNTSNDLLLELFIAPTKVDEHEFTILDVTLTDSVNKNEKVTIRLERITANNLYHYVHFASACANSKEQFSEQKPVMARMEEKIACCCP